MEVLQIQPPEPSMMFLHQGGMSRTGSLYNSPKVLTCYGFETTSLPSRTPTPERRSQSCSPPSPPVPCHLSSPPSSGPTLMESVLMGCVPKAYSHMVSSTRNSTLPSSSASSSSSAYSMSSASSTVSSCHESMEEDAQTEPMDLSCKRGRLSSPSVPSPRPAPGADHDSSMLRRLLQQGKDDNVASTFSSASSCYASGISNSPSPSGSAASPSGTRCDSPDSDKSTDSFFSRPGAVVTGSTRVTLAKKTMFPVCSRVADLLFKVVQFTKSIPEFMRLTHNDKVTLILNSWSKLLLLYMAEANFQFVVTPMFSEQSIEQESPSAGEPTMRGVDNIQNFIRKCQQLNLDGKEYAFLKMLILFNSSYVGLERPDVVEQLNSVVQHLLKQHVDSRALEDYMHFSKVLLSLPALYGTDSRMVENLFCKHIAKNTDMEVLLKEMLQNE